MSETNKNGLKSVSRLNAVLEIQGRGTIEYELIRHFAPLTINKVIKALPVSDTVHFYDGKFAYINTKLQVGGEKPRTDFQSGDIAFLTSSSSICFILQRCRVLPMNMLGIAKSSIDPLRNLKVGSTLTLKK